MIRDGPSECVIPADKVTVSKRESDLKALSV